jgi:hypothetical protein
LLSNGSAGLCKNVLTTLIGQVVVNEIIVASEDWEDDTPTVSAASKLRVPGLPLVPGARLQGEMVFMISPAEFYVQQTSTELEPLMESIQVNCSTATAPATGLGPHDACLALFPEDQVWYRASVSLAWGFS